MRLYFTSRFVEDTITLMEEEGESYKVKARMALMKKQLKEAEHIYMSNVCLLITQKNLTLLQNANEETLNMYQTLHKWGTAMELAKAIVRRCPKQLFLLQYIFRIMPTLMVSK